MKRFPLWFIVPLMIWGCSGTVTEPSLDAVLGLGSQPSIPGPNADGAEGVVQAVTGSGQLHASTNDVWRTFTIHAVKASDGAVQGTFGWRAHMGKTGSKVKGKVLCFTVAGNQAWLAVVFEKAQNPANIGKWASIRAVDNGEGMESVPDELGIRWRGFPGEGNDPEDFCVGQPTDLELLPLEAGNLQIHR